MRNSNKSKHRRGYDVETDKGFVRVEASNRTQAAHKVKCAGVRIISVNFTG